MAPPSFGVSDFKKLRVWRKAHSLALNVHRVASSIRGAQNVSMRSQMVRAAMSIPANIVEGREQQSEREFARFLGYSLGSSSELENHLIAARDVKAISSTDYTSTIGQLIDVRKMLHGLRTKLLAATPSTPKRPVPTPAAKSAKRSAGSRRQRS
jgi:four helix bundle protein